MDRALSTRAIAIISSHHANGTLVATSPEAHSEGLYTGMPVTLARKMSHGVQLLPYNRALYHRLNRYLYRLVANFTPVVEPSGFGQFYLDLTGMDTLYPSFAQAGTRLTRTIADKTHLSGQVGISINKLVSRITTAVVPEPVHAVPYGEEVRFLAPLMSPVLPATHEPPVKKLLRFLFLDKVEQIQLITDHAPEARTLFGDHARALTRESHGRDTSVVRPPAQRDHLMEQTVLPSDTNDIDQLQAVVKTLAEQIAFQLRQRRQIARKVRVEVHYTDGFRRARHAPLPANDDATVVALCQRLFTLANDRRNRVRAILIDASRFTGAAPQLDLFARKDRPPSARSAARVNTLDTKPQALSQALDRIRRQHGIGSIGSANTLRLHMESGEIPA